MTKRFTAIVACAGLFAVMLLMLATPAFAQAASAPAQAALGWTPPTKYIDNTTLAAADIQGYAVFYGPQSRFSSGTTLRSGCAAKPASQTDASCYPSVSFSTGSAASFTVTTTITQSTTLYFASSTKTVNGAISAYSNEANKAFTVTTTGVDPNAPIVITLTITLGACTTNVPGTGCTVTAQ